MLAAGEAAIAGGVVTGSVDGMQIVSVASTSNSAVHTEEMAKGAAFAQERAEREARLQRPLFVMPTKRHVHLGLRLPLGRAARRHRHRQLDRHPDPGGRRRCGHRRRTDRRLRRWVKLRHADGTVTLYGHLSTTLVDIGQRVWAGDQIATMGNRGNSTGPHLHFEVLLNGTDRVDPVGWLAKRGVSARFNYAG